MFFKTTLEQYAIKCAIIEFEFGREVL